MVVVEIKRKETNHVLMYPFNEHLLQRKCASSTCTDKKNYNQLRIKLCPNELTR